MPKLGNRSAWVCALVLLGAPAAWAGSCETKFKVVVRGHSPTLRYAADELRDYGRRLFGADWSRESGSADLEGFTSLITISSDELGIEKPAPLAGFDAYDISTSRTGIHIHGVNDRSALYGVYELLRFWGARFYLSGDVLPEDATCLLPPKRIEKRATLRLRGVHPYPDFLAGPTSWDEEQYEKYIRQLPKLGLNFLGIHQYTYEPYFDYEADGRRPRSGHLETSATREWGYGNLKTCDFEVGRGLFDGCEWGARAALEPRTPDERYARGEKLMAYALGLAHKLGLVTAFGFEPLSNDPEFADLVKTPEGLKRVTEARVKGVLRAFPELDYLWLFTDESHQMDETKLRSTYRLIRDAEVYLKRVAPAKHLIVGGWNVERTLRQYDAGYDGVRFAPDTIFTSYGNYDPWRTVTEKRWNLFQGLEHSSSIATWCEYDGRLLAGLQPNVSAYYESLRQLREAGSLGFFFLHWNTRLCDSNLDYLARAGWEERSPEPVDFYREYFAGRFGAESYWAQGLAIEMQAFERVNKSFAYGAMAFWLMADDWTPEGPWSRVARMVADLKRGKSLSDDDRAYLKAQHDQAEETAKSFSELDHAVENFGYFAREGAHRDFEAARFLANRAKYFDHYLHEYVRLSRAVDQLLWADSFVRTGSAVDVREHLGMFALSLDMKRWLETLSLYTEYVDDRGEKGIVVSLNQKILAGLRALERELGKP